jgi:CheY-like chemotaxis protein
LIPFVVLALLAREATIHQVSFDDSEAEHTYTILVVEDEVLQRQELANQLRLSGFKAIEANNGEEALSIILAGTHVDLMLLDLRMPGHIDGRELVRWTRRRDPHIKLVVLSAYLDPYWYLPVDATFAKPVRVEELLHRLRQLLPPAERAGPSSVNGA